MKITNHTQYNTKDLQRLFRECIKREFGYTRKDLEVKYLRVIVKQGTSYSGRMKRNVITLNIPETNVRSCKLAWSFINRFYHIIGANRKEMLRDDHYFRDVWPIDFEPLSWTENFLIETRLKVPLLKYDEPLVKKSPRTIGYEKAKETLKKKEQVLKRVANQVKKYRTKVKYYERVLQV